MADYYFEKEKQEAITAGERALSSLKRAKQNLDSAKNWGLWDMFGGGMLSSIIKHSKIDSANQEIEQAKCDLQNFSKELRDISSFRDFKIETGDFRSFADCFLDNVFVDWMVQDRINQARDQVDEVIRRVEDVVIRLRSLPG